MRHQGQREGRPSLEWQRGQEGQGSEMSLERRQRSQEGERAGPSPLQTA